MTDDNKSKLYYGLHGSIMYICWSFLSLVQIYLNRYLRHMWRWRQLAHSIVGSCMLILTISAAILALNVPDKYAMKVKENPHPKLGKMALAAISLVGLFGIVS